MQHYTVYFCKLLFMFQVDPPPIITSITLYLQRLVLVKPLQLPAAIVEVTSFDSSTIAAGGSTVWQIPDAVDTVVCAPGDRWGICPKHVEQFTEINKLCNVASCWTYFGIKYIIAFIKILLYQIKKTYFFPHRCCLWLFIYISEKYCSIIWNNQQMQLYAVNFIPLLGPLYMFRVFYTPIIRSTIFNCIYSHW